MAKILSTIGVIVAAGVMVSTDALAAPVVLLYKDLLDPGTLTDNPAGSYIINACAIVGTAPNRIEQCTAMHDYAATFFPNNAIGVMGISARLILQDPAGSDPPDVPGGNSDALAVTLMQVAGTTDIRVTWTFQSDFDIDVAGGGTISSVVEKPEGVSIDLHDMFPTRTDIPAGLVVATVQSDTPEPAAVLLLTSGLTALLGYVWLRRRFGRVSRS
jgi:hypothetical protein